MSNVLKAVLVGGLVCWVAAAPLVWILRDGLGPDMVESSGFRSAYKFLLGWGVPALALALPLAVLWRTRPAGKVKGDE